MAKRKVVELHGVEGVGDTVTEAKAHARKELDALVQRMETGPSVFHVHGLIAFVWPDTFGWCSRVDYPGTRHHARGEMFGHCAGYRTKAEAVLSALANAAQMVWNHDRDDEAFVAETFSHCPPGYAREAPEPRDREAKERELLHWCKWQRDYKRLRDLGASDAEAHQHAGHNNGFDDMLRARQALRVEMDCPTLE